jgi:hypothetical protein
MEMRVLTISPCPALLVSYQANFKLEDEVRTLNHLVNRTNAQAAKELAEKQEETDLYKRLLRESEEAVKTYAKTCTERSTDNAALEAGD